MYICMGRCERLCLHWFFLCLSFSVHSLRFAPVENRDSPRAVGCDRASSSCEHAGSSFPFYRAFIGWTLSQRLRFHPAPSSLPTVSFTSTSLLLRRLRQSATAMITRGYKPSCVLHASFVSPPR